MLASPRSLTQVVCEPLAWDSTHFGFAVARLTGPADEQTIAAALGQARRQGIHLVYWATSPEQRLSSSLLREFGGTLVDRKATFAADLPLVGEDNPALPPSMTIREYPKGPATRQLLDLSVAAGVYCRFAVDPRLPRAKFIELYEIWMQRSTLHELADVVLVASTAPSADGLGMVTIARTGETGCIGLVAVHQAARGKGVGSALVQAAHGWMEMHGATRATVVTQLANRPACRLYERAGYRLEEVQHYYHFWL
jgi:dTDP-4-amino-4,6-dideoxy-D-galactose acyltransferase